MRLRLVFILLALMLAGSAQAPAATAAEERLEKGERVVQYARRFLGVPYRWGGASPSGFDCSGFTLYVYKRFGVRLPHNAAAQYRLGLNRRIGRLRPGDLLFFHGLGHVGMYIGDGRMIHSPRRGTRVRIDPLAGHYRSRLVGVRRLVRWE